MSRDIQKLLKKVDQEDFTYFDFADPEEGPEDRPIAEETIGLVRMGAVSPDGARTGLLRRYAAAADQQGGGERPATRLCDIFEAMALEAIRRGQA